ncbi:MAG: transglutaminase-like cysteine peptidase [Rhodothermales bacterium]
MPPSWTGLMALFLLVNTAVAQPESTEPHRVLSVAQFNALFRDLDLNEAMQQGYAITDREFTQLRHAWKSLSESARAYLLDSANGWTDFASMLLMDLYLETSWPDHVRKAHAYGARGISLTVSTHGHVITVKQARATLVDLLDEVPLIQVDGALATAPPIRAKILERAGRKAVQRMDEWVSMLNAHRQDDAWAGLNAVVEFFGRHIVQTPDAGENGANDYWQSPLETLVRGRGDCDDFAMAHYITLRLLGTPANRLRIAVVDHPTYGLHGVVFYYAPGDSDPWVLDNLDSDRLGGGLGRVQRLSVRMRADNIQPLWGMNEDRVSEFGENLHEVVSDQAPRTLVPAFARAMANARSLLLDEEAPFEQPVATLFE